MSGTADALLKDYAGAKRRFSVQLSILEDLRSLAVRSEESLPEISDTLQVRIKPLELKLSEEIAELCAKMELAESLIRQIEDPLLKEILERRYLLQTEFKTIAEEMHYSERHIRRLHQAALKRLPETVL